MAAAKAATFFIISANAALAEALYQVSDFQALREYCADGSNKLSVDILNAGEWINISACGEFDANAISVEVCDPQVF